MEKLEMERVEKAEMVEKCEMEARLAKKMAVEARGSERLELSDILSEEEESEVGEEASWLEASDHFSELEFDDQDLLLSSVGAGCEILTVEEDVEDDDKVLKPGILKAKKKRGKHRGKFSSATKCNPSKASQQIPSSSLLTSNSLTSKPEQVEAPQIPSSSSRIPQDWLAINLAGFIFFLSPFFFSLNFSFSSFSTFCLCPLSILKPSFEIGMFDKKAKVDKNSKTSACRALRTFGSGK